MCINLSATLCLISCLIHVINSFCPQTSHKISKCTQSSFSIMALSLWYIAFKAYFAEGSETLKTNLIVKENFKRRN